ncbi:MAG: hypothetical protein AB1758_22960 [Candidatus Eremiobacterota bacterium]
MELCGVEPIAPVVRCPECGTPVSGTVLESLHVKPGKGRARWRVKLEFRCVRGCGHVWREERTSDREL